MSTAIEFNNISKLYRLGLVSSGTLSNDLKRWWQMSILGKEDPFLKVGSVNDRSKAADSEYVWALKDIDFKVEQGDVVGIIGKNGAGKSTLLKLLSKVTAPTTGTIKARGRIASLLEVGTGFHGELTGRENIYMNGAILGMSKQEINSKIDEIVAFSGCERYIDTPVKRYSSGMTVRLGFAVAAHLDPEILVVDEVLAVGDAEFQKKAIGKMQEVSKGEGRTVLFVSHNMGSIKALCKSGVLLENGTINFIGPVHETVTRYLSSNVTEFGESLADRKDREGIGGIRVNNIVLTSMDDKPISHVLSGQDYKLRFEYVSTLKEPQEDILLGVSFNDENGVDISLAHNRLTGQQFTVREGQGVFEFIVHKNPLNAGLYSVTYSVMGKNGKLPYLDLVKNAIKVKVSEGDYYKSGELAPRSFGPLLMDVRFVNIQ